MFTDPEDAYRVSEEYYEEQLAKMPVASADNPDDKGDDEDDTSRGNRDTVSDN